MSIFASTPAPALIHIPSFSSPEKPHGEDDSTIQVQEPLRPLTRAEEKQKRFRNINTKWESLGRLLEDHKAKCVSVPSRSAGEAVGPDRDCGTGGGEVRSGQAGNDRRKSARSTSGANEALTRTQSRVNDASSPKGKRVRKEVEETEEVSQLERGDERSGKRVARVREPVDTTTGASRERAQLKGKAKARETATSTSTSKQATQPPPDLDTTRVQRDEALPDTSATATKRGRIPRAAMRKAPLPKEPISTGSTNDPTPPSQARLPLNPVRATTDGQSVLTKSPRTSSIRTNATGSDEVKARKKSRAALPSRSRSPSPALVTDRTRDLEEEEVTADSQPLPPGRTPGRTRQAENGEKVEGGAKKQKREVSKETDAVVMKLQIKEKEAESTQGANARVTQAGERAGEETKGAKKGRAKVVAEKSLPEKSSSEMEKTTASAKAPKKRPGEADDVVEKRKRARVESIETRSTSSSPPPTAQREPTQKKAKTVIAPAPSQPFETVAPPLLSPLDLVAPPKQTRAKQVLVRSERLESEFSKEGKVNVFDVLVEGTKAVMDIVADELDQGDEEDRHKMETLNSYVAELRLPLLYRSAAVSEHSALQRQLTTSKAKSKELKAEVEALKKKTKQK